MTHVRTKICGLCSADDARAAVAAGADALGLVFAHNSRRRLDTARAVSISQAIGPFVSRVALFMNDDATMIGDVVESVTLDMLQFHGDETPAFCRSFGKPYMKWRAESRISALPVSICFPCMHISQEFRSGELSTLHLASYNQNPSVARACTRPKQRSIRATSI